MASITVAPTPPLPQGIVTFLLTDIEGSTKLWEESPQPMAVAVTRHDALAARLIVQHNGMLVKSRGEGDSLFAVFARTTDAVLAAYNMQKALHAERWPTPRPILVRMALHVGEAELRDGDYFGGTVNRCARLRAAGSGGQILVSQAVREVVRDTLPSSLGFRDLGEHRLRDLTRPERVFQLMADDLPHEFGPLHTLNMHPNNLPVQRDALIGRERQVNAVQTLLRQPNVRLVTLLGPGGTGKTRLALHVAADMLDDFDDGVYLVPLAAVRDTSQVVPAIAYTLDVREIPPLSMVATLKERLRDRQMLLVLDNFEQVVDAAAEVVDLLDAAAGPKMLVTSRTVLRVRGEAQYLVPPLTVPDSLRLAADGNTLATLAEYEAVRLFVERARAARPDFALTPENAVVVAQICQRLDGLPLAIELAATRIRTLSPQAMLARLNHRLQLLTVGARDLPSRHQTLRAAIEWSYELLDPPCQTLLRRLAVFSGGSTLEAIEGVVGDMPPAEGETAIGVLDGIEALASQSLLQSRDQRPDEPRFVMLATIQEFAAEELVKSGEGDILRERHARYFLAFVRRAQPNLFGPQAGLWLDRLESEHDNLRDATRWFVESGLAAEALHLTGAMWRFWEVRGYLSEGRTALEEALRLGAEAAATDRIPALNGAGILARNQSDYAAARRYHQQTLELAEAAQDLGAIVSSLGNLGIVAQAQGDYSTAEARYHQALTTSRQLGDQRGVAGSLYDLGWLAFDRGEWETARRLHQESLGIRREVGDRLGVAYSLLALGHVARAQNNYDDARARYEESRQLAQAMGDRLHVGVSLYGLGVTAWRQGHWEESRQYYLDSLNILRDLGSRREIVACLMGLGIVAAEMNQFERAARLLGASGVLLAAMEARLPALDQADLDHYIGLIHLMSDASTEGAFAAGGQMTLEEAMAYAAGG